MERSWQLLQPEYEGRVHLEVIDLLDHPEVAERYRVLRTPAVILNDRLRTQGSLSKERLRVLLDEALHARSVAAIGEETIRA
ncbi:MAG: thioredoxin family protein [Actinomycetota bacterium]|nr:thioredoxin family protein [Actinomycetota bacterium]